MDRWSSLLLLAFERVNFKLKKLQFRTRTTYWLCFHYFYHRLYFSRGLHYRLCYSIKFIVTLNEGLRLQLLAPNFIFLTDFALMLLKFRIAGPLAWSPWSLARGPRAALLSIRGPGASCLSVRGSGPPGC